MEIVRNRNFYWRCSEIRLEMSCVSVTRQSQINYFLHFASTRDEIKISKYLCFVCTKDAIKTTTLLFILFYYIFCFYYVTHVQVLFSTQWRNANLHRKENIYIVKFPLRTGNSLCTRNMLLSYLLLRMLCKTYSVFCLQYLTYIHHSHLSCERN